MNKQFFNNPVIKGGYPDPSVCRVGETYYMVTSSFYYFPGLPVFKSKDLVHWEQIGNAISRTSQLDFKNCDSSEGLWAATIRYHNNTFYIIGTLTIEGSKHRQNFIITSTDPAEDWSDAVIIEGAIGIDPSLYFNTDDSIWYCSNMVPQELKYPEQKMIYLQQLDKHSLQFIGERHIIYDADTDKSHYLEGPHIYFINNYYYLLTACGGTQTNHGVNIARSKNITGPYIPCPRNPIVTNRGLRIINDLGVSVVGHGDLVKTQNGEWYMVLLGIRPYKQEIDDYEKYQPRKWIRTPDRNKDAQFNLGREVFLIPIAWDFDEWPIVDNENGMVNLTERKPNLPEYHPKPCSKVDNFEESQLGLAWCMRRPSKQPFYSLSARQGCLRLYLNKARAEDTQTPSLIVRRQQHYSFSATASMEFEPKTNDDEAGVIITQNERFAFLLVKQMKDYNIELALYRIVNGERNIVATIPITSARVYLTIEGGKGYYNFYYGLTEHQLIPIALNEDGSLLSTLVADGYIGSYIGVYASGDSSINYADFDWFSYEIIEN